MSSEDTIRVRAAAEDELGARSEASPSPTGLAVRARGLSKCYHLYPSPRDRLKQLLWRGRRRFYHEFWALHDVSFEIRKGETVGIIGRNGSGKSTLLQLVCGTLAPTTGGVAVDGRVAAMLELGAGFNPEFTGRENVYLNGQILGLSKSEVDRRFEEIRRFADIGEFIDHPVKTYSSGMHVRLAFAVMAHVDADVLVIDEALSVGDALFTQKCMRFLRSFRERGTLLFVSHDTVAVTALCDRAIWLDGGRVRAEGPAKRVCEQFLEALFAFQQGESPPRRVEQAPVPLPKTERPKDQRLDYVNRTPLRNDVRLFEFDPSATSFGRRGARVVDVHLEDAGGARLAWVVGGETITLSVTIQALQALDGPIVGFFVRDRLGQNLFGDNTCFAPLAGSPGVAAGERLEARFTFDLPLLPSGDYSISAAVAEGRQHDHVQHEWIHDALLFRCEASSIRHALVGLPMRQVSLARC